MTFSRITYTLLHRQALATAVAASLIVAFGCSPAAPPEAPVQEAGPETAAAPPGPPPPPWKQHLEELHPTLHAWAAAWSDQDVDAYLSYYSPNFQLPNGMSREAWEDQRRQRLTAPSEIAVVLDNLQTAGFNKSWIQGKQYELVKVRFRQSYRSNTFSDEVEKELQVEWIDRDWKIVTETSL